MPDFQLVQIQRDENEKNVKREKISVHETIHV